MSWSSKSVAMAHDIVQAILIKRVMLQFQEVLSIYKIEFCCELTIAILIWANLGRFGSLFWSKICIGG